MKCDHCLFRINCVVDRKECAITYIEDDTGVGDEMPHPTEIEFSLKIPYAKFIGNQLLIWVDEKTIRALASMRPIEVCDQAQGYDGLSSAYLNSLHQPSICFIPQTAEEEEAEKKAQGWRVFKCPICGGRSMGALLDRATCLQCKQPMTEC